MTTDMDMDFEAHHSEDSPCDDCDYTGEYAWCDCPTCEDNDRADALLDKYGL